MLLWFYTVASLKFEKKKKRKPAVFSSTMKNFVALATAALAAQGASAHYIFQALAKGTGKGVVYEYVRRNTNYNSPVVGSSLLVHWVNVLVY